MESNILLKKNLNIWMALSLVVGMVIGSGVFFKATPVAKYSGSFTFIFLAWFLGGVMSLCGALVAAEFSARYPHTGGLYVYLEKIYGNEISFLFGWMNTLIYTPAILSALSVLFADQVSSMLNANQILHDILALGKNEDGYNTFLYPITPLVAIFSGLYILVNNIFSNPTDSIFSILVTILGLPVYVIFVKKKN